MPSCAAEDQAATRRLLETAQRGDRHAEDDLVRRFEPLVQRAVCGMKLPPWCEREDLAQEARLGLVAAVRAWRQERGAFPAFAQRCVRNQALLAVISTSSYKHQALNLAATLEDDAAGDPSGRRVPSRLGESLSIPGGAKSDPESRLLIREQIESLLHALPTLTPSERGAIAGGLRGHTHKQIAQALRLTPKAASQAVYRARRKLAYALPRAA
jgi:RNA polymerase sigma factor (sigma-70 family)